MEPLNVVVNGGTRGLFADPVSFARSYQLEALEKAIKQNTIVFLETGSGKTLIAIMLLRSYAHLVRKPSPFICVFLVPTVVLVNQQAGAIMLHTDLKVGKYWGDMGVDYWDAAIWKEQQDKYEVLVMTPAILLDALRRSFLKLDKIKVLIFDECHNARGKHPYACIMMEFYHPLLSLENLQLPRVFGMTASPIKAKGSSSTVGYWKQIEHLENLMNSKVYTCINESVLAEYIPFATTKLKFYNHQDIPYEYLTQPSNDLERLKIKYELWLGESGLPESSVGKAEKKLEKICLVFGFCMRELGIWLALKAAESLASVQNDIFSWGELDASSDSVVRGFCLDACKVLSAPMPSEKLWSITSDNVANVAAGYLTSKVVCLLECLHEYRDLKDLRCIIFVERIITAVVLQSLLNEVLPKVDGWKTEYMAGNQSGLQSQSRKEQNKIVQGFRCGTVNIIVATSILEEGLDVQSCNLVIRFDPSATVCSFIQSRGRARKQNSDFIIMINSNDSSTRMRVENYLASGDMMREASLSHAFIPCAPLDLEDEVCYRVEATGAIVTLSSSVQLLHFYCSRLPSDGYFKPYPRFVIDKGLEVCTLHLPKSCPITSIVVQGNSKLLKQLACLEACKQLHLVGALTNNLVPDIVVEEANVQEAGFEYNNEVGQYIPPELIHNHINESETLYYCYLLELHGNFFSDTQLCDVLLAVRSRFDDDCLAINFSDNSSGLDMCTRYVGTIKLTSEQVLMCQRFQVTLLRILMDHNLSKLNEALSPFDQKSDSVVCHYLLLPTVDSNQNPPIDWNVIYSLLHSSTTIGNTRVLCSCARSYSQCLYTKSGHVCSCMLKNSLVCTPHNGYVYYVAGTLDGMDGKSTLVLQGGEVTTYQKYYEKSHGIHLDFEGQSLLNGRHIPTVQNCLLKCRKQKRKGSSDASVELPPELCLVVFSQITLGALCSFSYIPPIMHRIESLLLAANLIKMPSDHCTKNVIVPTIKVLEAITTKKCQENLHLESLETLGDSFLKYAVSQQLFKRYQSFHEGLLSIKRERVISNIALCKLGCERKIPGFILNEPFDLKTWIIPGDNSVVYELEEIELSPGKKVYSIGKRKRKIKSKVVADVVEALIGAFLSTGGEIAALSFMQWLGIEIDFVTVPYVRHFSIRPEVHLNVRDLASLLNYSFHDASFLVEALTHGSYMLPEIPRCYQRLEFLGDAVLDYLVTVHLYNKYPSLSPGLLTDLRSASVNNDCYAQSALKAGLHKHILHASLEFQRQLNATISNLEQLSLPSTFGWESDTTFPKVLGDVMESIAGAILVDSNYNKEVVFQSIRPLLEPLITLETLRLHPVRELGELCQRENYIMKKHPPTREHGKTSVIVEVEANGVTYKGSGSAPDRKAAKKLACKNILKSLKENVSPSGIKETSGLTKSVCLKE